MEAFVLLKELVMNLKGLKIGQTRLAQVKDPKMLTKCPECSKPVDSNDAFCNHCGYKMRKEGKGEDLELNIALDPNLVPTNTHPGVVNQPFGPAPSNGPMTNPGIPGGGNPLAKLTALANRVASYDNGKHRDCAERILSIAKRFGGVSCNKLLSYRR
jgi:hypothetical protein